MTAYLRRFSLFDPLTDADVDLLERVFVEAKVPAGHVFVREDERTGLTSSMFLILEGTVGVRARAPTDGFGVERTLAPGQMFGAVALVADVPRTATVTALTGVRVARLDRRSFDELKRGNVGVHARFQLVVARSLAADLRALRTLLVASVASGDEAGLRARFG